MSRLQVGGLALVIGFDYEDDFLGKIVTLKEYRGFGLYGSPVGMILSSDDWIVFDGCSDDVCISSKNLMPLGDKQTQNELAKEKELEYLK